MERPLGYNILSVNSAALGLTDLLRGNTLHRNLKKLQRLGIATFPSPKLQLPFVLPSLLVVDGLPPGLGLRF
jgi:hypothetical protein